MEASERHGTQGLPPSGRLGLPLPLSELEGRIDEALATARASEAAVMTVGAAALDAAEQARRAAELAERASAALLGERPPPPAAASALVPPEPAAGEIRVTVPAPPVAPAGDDGLRAFNLRADRVEARLRALGSRPVILAG